MKTALFNFKLPENLIAQKPVKKRDLSNLAVLDRKTGKIKFLKFNKILNFFEKGDVLVLNNTKVIPARIKTKRKTGGKVEILLLKKIEKNLWECLLKPLKKIKISEEFEIAGKYKITVLKKQKETAIVKLSRGLEKNLSKVAKIPLPPYIKEKKIPSKRYQTVYAWEEGSVAAPTAGLHFTKKILNTLKKNGVEIAFITLDISWGTFKPIRTKNIDEHKMEEETFWIPKLTSKKINRAIEEKRRVVACGTTVVRALESASFRKGKKYFVKSGKFSTNLFIKPGYKFKIVRALITNFHTPNSTLLVLVSAFAGRNLIMKTYKKAIEKKWRFFSFGDAMFIL